MAAAFVQTRFKPESVRHKEIREPLRRAVANNGSNTANRNQDSILIPFSDTRKEQEPFSTCLLRLLPCPLLFPLSESACHGLASEVAGLTEKWWV